MRTLIFDIEANNLMPKVSRIHCLAIRDADTEEEWVFNDEIRPSVFDEQKYFYIDDGLALLDKADVIVGHNIINYDLRVLKKLKNWEPMAEVRDTLVCSRLIHANLFESDFVRRSKDEDFPSKMIGRHSLKAWGYRLGILKGMFLENNGMEKWSPELEKYCIQDVRITDKLLKFLLDGNVSHTALDLSLIHI